MRYDYKHKRQAISHVGEDVEQQVSYSAGSSGNVYDPFGKLLGVIYYSLTYTYPMSHLFHS